MSSKFKRFGFTTTVKSYTINKTDKFILILETRKVGKQFYYGKIYLNIIEQTTLAYTGK